MSAIRIKIPTDTIIKALENRLVENEKAQKENEKAQKAWEAEMKGYADKVFKFCVSKKVPVADVSTRWDNRIEISFRSDSKLELPKAPEKAKTDLRTLGDYQVKEIENALTLLRMTNEPFVNTSAYKDVAQYL